MRPSGPLCTAINSSITTSSPGCPSVQPSSLLTQPTPFLSSCTGLGQNESSFNHVHHLIRSAAFLLPFSPLALSSPHYQIWYVKMAHPGLCRHAKTLSFCLVCWAASYSSITHIYNPSTGGYALMLTGKSPFARQTAQHAGAGEGEAGRV